ncbi:hypothetical protein PC9H_010471 [Pleurotus ostreatus]|uniref:DUF6534 domain-containing protein n=1 Tax=Pleurotus ostreatus TaxID=5322 RepID=A0A8H6ZJX5_PLEOS|nr:uncharacterized protein PC9H_010471 [Pleurotus ostreatus]KAF7422315.1 hypothetical protein PC9H_010471 [Pleurotus ostreatus]
MSDRIVIHNSMGAAFIGCVLASALYGVSTIQTFYYYNNYGRDPIHIRALVLAVWIFDTTHQVLISHTVYHYVISNYFNPLALMDMVWRVASLSPAPMSSILVEVLFNGFIGFIVQSYLTYRIWRLSNKKIWVLCLIGPFVLAEFICSVVFTVMALQMKTFGELTALKGLSMTVNILAAVGDLFISICLVYMLYRRRTGYKKSNTIISRLIIFTINTGSLTTLFAIGSLISILVWDDTLIYVTFFFCIGRLYANTFLATLNARSILRSVGQDDDANTIHLSGANTTEEAIGMSKGTRPRNISIQIDTARDILRDDDDSNTMKGKISSS